MIFIKGMQTKTATAAGMRQKRDDALSNLNLNFTGNK